MGWNDHLDFLEQKGKSWSDYGNGDDMPKFRVDPKRLAAKLAAMRRRKPEPSMPPIPQYINCNVRQVEDKNGEFVPGDVSVNKNLTGTTTVLIHSKEPDESVSVYMELDRRGLLQLVMALTAQVGIEILHMAGEVNQAVEDLPELPPSGETPPAA